MVPPKKSEEEGSTSDVSVSLQQYVETRFNLLLDLIERGDATVKELLQQHDVSIHKALEAQLKLSEADRRAIRTEMEAQQRLFETVHETTKRAVDKAETAQLAHNTAANEWRATLSAFQAATIGRPEFDRFYAEFSAYRLEASRIQSLNAGQDVGAASRRSDSMGRYALIVAAVAAAVALLNSGILGRIGN